MKVVKIFTPSSLFINVVKLLTDSLSMKVANVLYHSYEMFMICNPSSLFINVIKLLTDFLSIYWVKPLVHSFLPILFKSQ